MDTLLGALEVLVDSGPDPNFEVEYSVSLDMITICSCIDRFDDDRVAS
jgi:hypothetical protein